jgi:benzoate transport
VYDNDPARIIDERAMSTRQWLAVGLTVALNALDGFDVLSSAFAGPGIKQEWQLGPAGLGAILSMELLGMGVGSLLLGSAADRFGRRPTILACLTLMASGMLLAATAGSPTMLSVWRVLTGIGIGGMLAAINAVAFELSSKRQRSFAMALMVIGYPLGAFIGGLIASALLQSHGWRSVFVFGGTMTLICIPLVLLLIPETPAWLARMRPANALARINHTLARFGHPPVAALPAVAADAPRASLADLFARSHRRVTLTLSFSYALHAFTFYYILKMVPAILADPEFAGQHFTKAQGAGVLAFANLGGAIGGGLFGWAMHRFGIKHATLVALALSVLLVVWFGFGQTSLTGWTFAVATVAFFTNASIVGYYAMFALVYPTQLKATGTGFALAVGRAGAALSPIAAGMLFADKLGLVTVSIVMATGSLLALVLFATLPDDRKPV